MRIPVRRRFTPDALEMIEDRPGDEPGELGIGVPIAHRGFLLEVAQRTADFQKIAGSSQRNVEQPTLFLHLLFVIRLI